MICISDRMAMRQPPRSAALACSRVAVEYRPDKGRILVSTADVAQGGVILRETPLVKVELAPEVPACASVMDTLEALQQADATASGKGVDYPPFFFWAAICSLTDDEASTSGCEKWPTICQAAEMHSRRTTSSAF
eukprot:TRINITY_DN49382_c0_g1_i3.p1 TRINITY_DN49382_c0_g1~~TRINITY_DN49382_c0_g1_i3.p1  ORF type:complete len:135 (+),score=29.05 TRINITY_DN49382_c0_g1_i3:141-545(+)